MSLQLVQDEMRTEEATPDQNIRFMVVSHLAKDDKVTPESVDSVGGGGEEVLAVGLPSRYKF